MDANFCMVISFAVFSVIFYKKLWPSIRELLDEHIANIKNQFNEKQTVVEKQEKLEVINQQNLKNLQNEINLIKLESLEKLDSLKQKLHNDMESQYLQRKKNLTQTVKRIQIQQRKALQLRCIDEIFTKITNEIQKDSSFDAKYMVSIMQPDKK